MKRIPGFLAETDLGPSTARYQESWTGAATGVAPQLPQLGLSCILTHDGGRWCCITGLGKRPLCFKIPPPIVIST